MPRTRLRTFMQISDLHVGSVDPVTYVSRADPTATALWARLPYLGGLLGHSDRALRAVYDFMVDLEDAGESPEILISGDLTCFGAVTHFRTVEQFLDMGLPTPPRGLLSLHCPRWRNQSIPGNHDHWPGTAWMFGPRTTGFQNAFPAGSLPDAGVVTQLTQATNLRLLRIDTDADIKPYSLDRFRALGAFESQLATLDGALHSISPKNEVRVLMLHHSRLWGGAVLEMLPASRAKLEEFVIAHRIAVLLCGHTHEADVEVRQITTPSNSLGVHVLEAVCGTSAQVLLSPYNWIPFHAPANGQMIANSVLVHRVYDDGGTIEWECTAYSLGLTDLSFIASQAIQPKTLRIGP